MARVSVPKERQLGANSFRTKSEALGSKERNSLDEKSYSKTIDLGEKMKEQGFKHISVWECEKPVAEKYDIRKRIQTLSILYSL